MTLMTALLALLAQDLVDNPEYKGWAAFKAGSSVTYKYNPQEGGQKVTLKSIGTTEAVVETEILLNGKTVGQKTERKIPAKLPADKVSKDAKEGEEEIDVAGKKMKCRTREVEKKTANGKTVTVKIWIQEDIPGSGAQVQTLTEAGGKFSMTATEWEKK